MSAMDELRFVDATQLEELGRRGGPVVVAFVATWNRRCQAFAVDYGAFAARCAAALPVVCVDVDESAKLTGAYDVCSVPTILLLDAGRELHREVGTDLAPLGAQLEARGYAPR